MPDASWRDMLITGGKSFLAATLLFDRLLACALAVPVALLLMLSLSVVQNRIQTLQLHDKGISLLRGELDAFRKANDSDKSGKKDIADREAAVQGKENERASISLQVIWGDQAARERYAAGNRDWGNIFHQNSNDHNLMLASMASAMLACLLSVILTGRGRAIYALGAGLIIGLFAAIAAKGAKAFLLAGSAANQPAELDPYSIVLLAFLAGAYQHRLLGMLERLVQGKVAPWGTAKPHKPRAATPGVTTGVEGPGPRS
jgi:hypothetical protein